jgi:hypothetical protein
MRTRIGGGTRHGGAAIREASFADGALHNSVRVIVGFVLVPLMGMIVIVQFARGMGMIVTGLVVMAVRMTVIVGMIMRMHMLVRMGMTGAIGVNMGMLVIMLMLVAVLVLVLVIAFHAFLLVYRW